MTSLKTCFKCSSTKPLDDFYRHAMMADGHLNKCKTCSKADVREHRKNNDSVRAYDRARAKLPHRRAKNIAVGAQWRKAHPGRRATHVAVGNAVRDGKIKPQPCWVCGLKAQAHHPDYSAPLDVVWLCPLHHKQLHREHNEHQRSLHGKRRVEDRSCHR